MERTRQSLSGRIDDYLCSASLAGQAALVIFIDDEDARSSTLCEDISWSSSMLGDRGVLILVAPEKFSLTFSVPGNCGWADETSARHLADGNGQLAAVYFDRHGTCRRRIYAPVALRHRVSLIRRAFFSHDPGALELGDTLT